MRRLLGVWVLLSCLAGGASAAEPLSVLLFAGQSNMAGRGVVAELDDATRARVAAVADRVGVIGTGRTVARPLGEAGNGFGPELQVGLTLAEAHPERTFLLVKTAVGGTSLYGAWSPAWTAEKALEVERGEERQTRRLYTEHQSQVAEVLGALDAAGTRYVVQGVFWMQGEMDTRRAVTAQGYGENLAALIAAYRADLATPGLPFVFGQVNCLARGKKAYAQGPAEVRKAMAEVADAVPGVAMVPTRAQPPWSDFSKLDDAVHYDTAGQLALGQAMAAGWQGLHGDG